MSNNIDQPTLIYCPSLSCETMGAFIVAIARQVRPLPTDLQAKIHDLGQQVQANAQLLEQPIKWLYRTYYVKSMIEMPC